MPPSYLSPSISPRCARDDPAVTLRLDARALVLGSDRAWRSLLPGQRATVTGRLLAPRGGDLRAAVLSVKEPPVLHGRSSWAQRAAGVLRAGLQRACEPLPDDAGGLLPGLVVGDTSRLDPALGGGLPGHRHDPPERGQRGERGDRAGRGAVRRCGGRGPGRSLTALVCAVALVGFVILARPSPSVVRAAAMGAIGLLGLAAGRPRAALPALAAGVAVLVVVDPELAGDAGLRAVRAGHRRACCCSPRSGGTGCAGAAGRPVAAEALAVPAAAQVACGPVVAGLSGSVSLVAVPANLLAVPAIAPATLLGVDGRGAVAGVAGRCRVRGLARALAGAVAGAGRDVRRAGAGRRGAVARRCAAARCCSA